MKVCTELKAIHFKNGYKKITLTVKENTKSMNHVGLKNKLKYKL